MMFYCNDNCIAMITNAVVSGFGFPGWLFCERNAYSTVYSI